MAQVEESCQGEPEFITYLLSPELKHDSYFIVGKDKVEKIGAVRKMLAAHSAVLRAELEDSEIKEKGEIVVNDLFPDTFRNLLKFAYGYNNVLSLTFEEADDLLYAADKYFLVKLKKQLTLRLMVLLNSQNVCSLLNNPVCHVELELNAKITEILQFETQDVLASPHFLNLRTEGFIKILEQECLNVPEIQLFRSALTWAKNRAHDQPTQPFKRRKVCRAGTDSEAHDQPTQPFKRRKVCRAGTDSEVTHEDGNQLRRQFEKLNHFRIRTISLQDFVGEVVPSGILTKDEVFQSCILYGKGEPPPPIDGFSNNTEPRLALTPLELKVPEDDIIFTSELWSVSLSIGTKSSAVGLLPLEIKANSKLSSDHYRCVCNVEIFNASQGTPPINVRFDELVACGRIFKIPLEKNGLYWKLQPNTFFIVKMSFSEPQTLHCVTVNHSCLSNDDLVLETITYDLIYRRGGRRIDVRNACFPFSSLKYVKLNQA